MSIDWNSAFDRYSRTPYIRIKPSPTDNYRKMIKKYHGRKKKRL